MGLLSKILGSKDGIDYRRVDYVQTHKNIRQFIALSQTPRSDGGKMYFKREIAEAINAIAGNCHKETLKQLVRVYPEITRLIEYK